ncbi:MAG: hypothetical protein ACREPA_09980 [Candidatus Dormibacteraceae bacterium]
MTVPNEERRQALRRLDDILEALEQLNLRDQEALPPPLVERLQVLGVAEPAQHTVPHLIELVWERQQPFLITLIEDRRRRPRRQSTVGAGRWT